MRTPVAWRLLTLQLHAMRACGRLGYILPAVVHFRLNPFMREWRQAIGVWSKSWRREWTDEKGAAVEVGSKECWRRSVAAGARVVPPSCLLIFGLLAMVLGTTSAVMGALEVDAGDAEGSCIAEAQLENATAGARRELLRMLP